MTELVKNGHNRDDVLKRIDEMNRDGQLMQPRHGILKLLS